jgi:hypothetical protein
VHYNNEGLIKGNYFYNNLLIGSQVNPQSAKGVVFVYNLMIEGNFSFTGLGINALYWTHHTMVNPQQSFFVNSYFKVQNNLLFNTILPAFPGTNNTVSNNYTSSMSGWSFKATDTSFSCIFTLDNAPFSSNPFITSEYIGPIPPSNQTIQVSVNQDNLGNSIKENSPVAGPFANLKSGVNTLSLWPRVNENTALKNNKGTVSKKLQN